MLVMAFSITPTSFLHNWLADHTDAASKRSNDGSAQVSNYTYNCNCDNIVAESPFTGSHQVFEFATLRPVMIEQGSRSVKIISLTPSQFFLRGPPAFA